MNIEDVLSEFRKKFNNIKKKKIIIYGIGLYAEEICRNCTDFNIIGLLDGNKTDGYKWGIKILSYEEILLTGAECIILASKITSVQPIYMRIIQFTHAHNIPVFYMNGTAIDLLFQRIYTNKINLSCINQETFKKQIDSHDIISFDIFDTLICRTTLFPDDVFDILEDRAESNNITVMNMRELRYRGVVENSQSNPNIFEIYEKIAELAELDSDNKERLMNLEIEIEKNVLIARNAMVELMDYAIGQGKKVYLVTDMYLTKDIIKQILDGLNVKGYQDIYISCEHRQMKQNGLLNTFKNGVVGESYLHIGDNVEFDGLYAGIYGMDFMLIKSPIELLRSSTYSHIETTATNHNERALLGMVISRVFNNPFQLELTQEKVYINNIYDVGYCFIAALITTFTLWIVDEIRMCRTDDILFAARDGYIIEILYNKIIKIMELKRMPKGKYFLTSRPLCLGACVDSEEDIRYMLMAPFRQTPPEIIKNKFNLKSDELLPYHVEEYDLVTYALAHKDIIINRSRELKNNYLKYIERLGLNLQKKYFFFDFVSRGSCQCYLNRLIPYNLQGIYFIRSNFDLTPELKNTPIKAYWDIGENDYVSKHYLFLETIMTSQKPSIKKMNVNGKPIFCDEMRTELEMKCLGEIHKAIIDFCTHYVKVHYIDGMSIGKNVVDCIYQLIDAEYTVIDGRIMEEIMLVDDWILERVPLNR